MPRHLALPFASLFLLAATTACGGDTHESLAKESSALMGQMVAILEGVTDKASAEAAKPRLEALAVTGKELQKRMSELGTPDAATQKRLQDSMGKGMTEMQSRMMTVGMRLANNPEVQAVLGPTMDKMEFGK